MITQDPAILDLVETARRIAVKTCPAYYRGALWALSFVVSDEVPTFAVDERFRCYVNGEFAKKEAARSLHGVAAILLHEALHPTFKHSARCKTCLADDRDRWNQAGDLEINQVIDGIPMKLPPEELRPRMFAFPEGETAESYYARLNKQTMQDNACAGGSGAGKPGPWETAGGGGGKVPAGLSEAQAQVVRIRIARAVQEAHAEKPGTVPANLLRWADELTAPPVIAWEQLLAPTLRSSVLNRRGPSPSYARPSRRMTGGLMLPVYRQPTPKVAIVGDTSGSMRSEDLARILSVVRDACLTLGKVFVIPCDAAASEPVEVFNLEDLRPYFVGGGGTDMRVGIARASNVQPDGIVVVTDCETGWPSEPLQVPVIVVSTRRGPYEKRVPEYATLIKAA